MEILQKIAMMSAGAVAIHVCWIWLAQARLKGSHAATPYGASWRDRHPFTQTRAFIKCILFILLALALALLAMGVHIVMTNPGAPGFVGAALAVFGVYLFKAAAEAPFFTSQVLQRDPLLDQTIWLPGPVRRDHPAKEQGTALDQE